MADGRAASDPSETCKGQLGLERRRARTLPGIGARIGLRLLAPAAGLWHNHQSVSRGGALPPTVTDCEAIV